MTQASVHPPGPPGPDEAASEPASTATAVGEPPAPVPAHRLAPSGPIERVMSTVIRKLAWSRLSDPKVAVSFAGVGLLLGMVVGATAPNSATLPIRLPLSVLPSLNNDSILAMAILYTGDILACLGLAGMLWAHSQGWRPNPRHLFLAAAAVIAVMVSLTPVGSSDTASYAAFGRISALGENPYTRGPAGWLGLHSAYVRVVGSVWKNQPSVYGPIATWVQKVAGLIGGPDVVTTVWVLMILNGAVFLAVGWLLIKTSDDPVRATLFWTANPVLIQQLVSGGHLDTFLAAAAICAIQVARRVSGIRGDVLVGVIIGLGCGIKVSMALVAIGLAWPMLMRREWLRVTRIAVVSLVVFGVQYIPYGLSALKPIFAGSKWVILPSPWRFVQLIGEALHATSAMTVIIGVLWPIAMIIIAWLIYQRISSDQPREVVAPFALSFAWILAAPWVFPWYTALAWVALTQIPRNRMTRWLALVTVLLAIWHSGGGQGAPGQM
ncbi:MAG: polyprenol phosphomannose-dependent alpha 1,6 mannosyltransferase MptB [Streptosporangiaceae bacterium]